MIMKAGEVKMRISNFLLELIDVYFPGNSFREKMVNSTLKIILKQKIYKIDTVLNLFSDKDGEINTQDIINEYSKLIDENGITFDLKEYIDDDMIKTFIPDKILIIKREDILDIFA